MHAHAVHPRSASRYGTRRRSILGLGLFSSMVWLSLRQRLLSELDQDLAGRSARFEQYFRGEIRGS